MHISIAVPKEFGLSLIIDNITHPDPVPTSKKRFEELSSVSFKTSSTIISVSGLGIRTFLFTKKLCFQKSFFSKMYAIGSFCYLLNNNFLNL